MAIPRSSGLATSWSQFTTRCRSIRARQGPASRSTSFEPAVAIVRELAGLMNLRGSSWIPAGSTH
jgi:hypothetical protein